jgi:hypothetical protein
MSKKKAKPKWSDKDTDALFSTLGKYWLSFQWIESQLDKILLLAWGHENWAASQARLAKMNNAQKIDSIGSIVLEGSDFKRVHSRPDWVSHFKSVIKALHTERERRNSITHSQILFDFSDTGLGPPLMSTRTRLGDDEERFEQRWLSKDFQETLLMEVGDLVLQVNFIYVQLVHDYRAACFQQDK